MEDRLILRWQGRDGVYRPKSNSWYVGVGVVAVGLAVASVIGGNYLFALISVLGGFTIMLVGSRRPGRKTYGLYERHIGTETDKIAFEKIARFAIHETEPRELVLELKTIVGHVTIPLGNVDYRRIVMELKNHDIEEVERLEVFTARVADWIGL